MKPIDTFNEQIISQQNAKVFLSEEDYKKFTAIEEDKKKELLKNLLEKPIAEFTEVNKLYFRLKWAGIINLLYGEKPITIVEVASGDADMIPQALSRSNSKSIYIALNMNKILNSSLLRKTKDLDITMKLIDDDAEMIKNYIPKNSIDVIAFQHGVNDVLQAILCGQNGIDTIYSDWMKCLPKMIELLQKEIADNSFEENVKVIFLNLIRNLLFVLKEDGIIIINHYMFQLDLDWGYPKELFENIVPMIRVWFKEINICKEVFYEGFDQHWWIFLKHN